MNRAQGKRRFGLIELVIGIAVVAVLIGGVYQVIVVNQRIQNAQASEGRGPSALQVGVDLLAQELREASPSGGDLLALGEHEIAFRASSAFGIACDILALEPLTVRVLPQGRSFEEGDDVFVFVDEIASGSGDGSWRESRITRLSDGGTCQSDLPAQTLVLQRLPDAESGGRVTVGSFVRAWEEVRYAVEEVDGAAYLVRQRSGRSTRLIGPLVPGTGLELRYFDRAGRSTRDPSAVRTTRVTVRRLATREGAEPAGGADSLSTAVFLRN